MGHRGLTQCHLAVPAAGSQWPTTSTSSSSSISVTKVASTGKTSRTTECTAASTSFRPLATGRGSPARAAGGLGRGSVGRGSRGSPRRLRPLDVEFMRALHQRVNIVPVLAKADTLTPAEVERMKNKVRGRWASWELSQQVSGHRGALGSPSISCLEFALEHFPDLKCCRGPWPPWSPWPPKTHLPGLSWGLEGLGDVYDIWSGGTGFWRPLALCGASQAPLEAGALPSGGLCLQIREEIDHYGIRIYQFPECDSDEDEEFKLQDQALKVGLAPLVPSLEGQSPVARRTHHPGVTCRTLWGHASSPTWRGWHISHYPDTSPSSHG